MSQMKGIEITLKPIAGGINRVLPPGINQVLQQEYANKYLESIGAYPTRENVDFVLNNLAIKDALVLPVWARSKIIIIPGMNDNGGDLAASMQEFLSENPNESYANHIDQKGQRSRKVDRAAELELENLIGGAKSSYTNKVGRRLSWATVNTLDLLDPLVNILTVDKRIAETFKLLMRPPDFNSGDVHEGLHAFIMTLPDYIPRVKEDKTFKLFKSVRKLLKSKACVQLYGLLVHFCYWNIIHPTARHTLQTLRDRHPVAETALFQDIDLTPAGMLQVRSIASSFSISPTAMQQYGGSNNQVSGLNTARSALTVEKLFVNEMLQGTEEVEEEEVSEADATSPLNASRPGSSAFNRGFSVRSALTNGTNSRPNSRGNSPHRDRSFFGMDRVSSSRKVGFNLTSKATSQRFKSNSSLSITSGGNGGESRSVSPSTVPGGPAELLQQQKTLDEDSLEESFGEEDVPMLHMPLRASSRPSSSSGADRREGGLPGQVPLGGASLAGSIAETEASLSAFEKEQLFMQLETCLTGLFKKVGKKKVDLVTGRQALVTCCHFIVDDVLTLAYPWFAVLPENGKNMEHAIHSPSYLDYANKGADWAGPYADSIKQLNLRLRRLVHQGLADIIDPSRLYTSSMLLSTITGKVSTRAFTNKGKSRFYTTSVATKALLGDTQSDAARRFLQQGRGVYTVLPGVVDPYTHTGPTAIGRLPDAASSDNYNSNNNVFNVLRDSSGRLTSSHFFDAPSTRPSTGNITGPSTGRGNSSKLSTIAPLRHLSFQGQGEPQRQRQDQGQGQGQGQTPRTQQLQSESPTVCDPQPLRQSTARTFAERVNSAAVRTSTNAIRNNCHKFGSGEPPPRASFVAKKSKLDFGNIFADQPDIGYFPVVKTETIAVASAALSASSQGNDWLNEFLPPGSRVNTNSSDMAARLDSSARRDQHKSQGMDKSKGTSSSRGRSAGSALDTFRMPADMQELASVDAPRLFSAQAMFPPSGESVSSNSYLSENRSIAHNKSAAMPLSLRAKASLMELMVDKTSSLYATEIQTNQVRTRIELLNLNSNQK